MTARWLVVLAVLACSVSAAAQALAVPIVGSSSGTFSNLAGCDSGGFIKDCQITGAGTQVLWGPGIGGTFLNPSTLTSTSVSITTATDANDVILAALNWFNSATLAAGTPDAFMVNWVLTIAFTQPTGSADTETFQLTVLNAVNPPGDTVTGLSLTDLSNLQFALTDVVVSDLKYSILDGPGGTGIGDTTLTIAAGLANWYNSEKNNASLFITGDFTYTGGPPALIPHPTPLLLLGATLAGVAVLVARRGRRR